MHLLDASVSRCHCELVPTGEGWSIRDRESLHGTFVNCTPVRERVLAHGDLLQVGGSSLLFLEDAGGDDDASAPADSAVAMQSTLQRRMEDNGLLGGRTVVPATATDLAALLRLCTSVAAARELDQVAREVLASVFASLPAERGCVLVAAAGAGSKPAPADLRIVAVRARVGNDSPRTSHDVLARVLGERVAVIADAEDAAVLCAPLVGRGRVHGALYVEASAHRRFGEGHLDLLQAAAAIAALALDNLSHLAWLQDENRRLRAPATAAGIVGESPVMKRTHAMIQRVASSTSTVLIRGESGTGKELCARAIHAASARRDGPFVAINCATLSETLLESELFGHEKGAFTGAVARKIGKVEAADSGTLFLDEIGELPVGLQARLLRVLQEREVDRVGSTRPISVDVRVVAATNRDLETAMRTGKFREDLYHRLNVVTLTMPPLRERPEDIPLLAQHFASTCAARVGRRVIGIANDARDALLRYDWPGNVRQLGNAVERALVLGSDEVIQPEDLPDEVLAARAPERESAPMTFHDAVIATKRGLIRDAYAQAAGDHQRAAERLGVHPNSLHRLIRNLGLKSELGKDRE